MKVDSIERMQVVRDPLVSFALDRLTLGVVDMRCPPVDDDAFTAGVVDDDAAADIVSCFSAAVLDFTVTACQLIELPDSPFSFSRSFAFSLHFISLLARCSIPILTRPLKTFKNTSSQSSLVLLR